MVSRVGATVTTEESDYDPWRDAEAAAVVAFKGSASTRAPGLMSVLRRSVHYARLDPAAREIVIDRLPFFLALLSVGVLDEPSKSYGNTATWIADAFNERASADVRRLVQTRLTGTDAILKAVGEGYVVVASPAMKQVAGRAKELAATTVSRKTADLRHFFAAFLEDRGRCLKDFADAGWTANLADLMAVKHMLYERVGANPERSENMKAWETLLVENEQSPLTLRREVAGFASDRAAVPFAMAENDVLNGVGVGLDRDPLELTADVRAFARLICLEEAEPPLSIGVFGGWGSGKTTFMQLLEEAVANLAAGQKKRRADSQLDQSLSANEPRFISNVVQVRFNAWHFADANLWASLTAEFFDQLRAGGYAGSGKAIHRRLVEKVNDHVHALTSEAATARRALAESEEILQAKQKERDKAVAQAQDDKSKRVGQTLADAVTNSFNEHKADLNEMGRRTYYDNPGKDIQDFIGLVKQLQSLAGQLKAVWSYMRARGARMGLAIGSFVLFLLAVIVWLWPSDLTAGAFQLKALGVFGLLASLGGFARSIVPGVTMVSNLAKSTADFAKELEGATAVEIETVAKADEAVRRAATEAHARRAAAERANKALARYIDPNAGTSNPPRLLRYMLEDDPDTRALEKEIGLISRVRRLFQAVDEIVAEEKKKVAPGNGAVTDPDVPDRIVIYIDDLDRCTPSQVYAVLQAVHLLLAFRLFVVVVGVDVEWVEHSLSKEFAPSIPPQHSSQSLAVRYLEKIFQLPFWLQRLSTHGADGGSYGRFVRLMLENNLPAEEDGAVEPTARLESALQGTGRPSTQNEKPEPDELPAADGRIEFEGAGLDEALSTVQLTQGEVEFLAMDVVGRLAGREPRTVKRFINIYRIIRARLDPSERQSFLGEDGGAAKYPIVGVLIAIETGQSTDAVADFYKTLRQSPREDLSALEIEPIAAAFGAAKARRRQVPVNSEECLALSRIVRRYSFNRDM